MWSDVPSIGILSLFTLLPFLVASGTCFVKFSIVFVMVRNALGLQQVPSNMTLNGVALLISLFVMLPVASAVMDAYQANPVNFGDPNSVRRFLDDGLSPYRDYLVKYADPQLTQFFAREEVGRDAGDIGAVEADAPRLRRQEPGDGAHGRRLAAAGGTEQGDELAPADGEVEVLDGDGVAIGERQSFEVEEGSVRHSGRIRGSVRPSGRCRRT